MHKSKGAEARIRKGELLEYSGKCSRTIPSHTVVRVKCEATAQKTVVEALNRDGVLVSLVLSNKFLREVRSLF